MMSKNKHTELAIIGAGPGGYPAAFRAADLGIKVTLIDPEKNPGGVCLYRGCIPSKALLHVAEIISETKNTKDMGISFSEPELDIKKIAAWKDGVVKKLTGGVGQLTKLRNIEYIRGKATFADTGKLKIERNEGSDFFLTYDHCIIATGSRPSSIPGVEIDNKDILDSTGALELKEVPGKLLVVGGGYIGLEMGTVYAVLGSEVTVVEMLDNILQGVDRDLVSVLEKRLKSDFESIMLGTKVKEIKKTKKGLNVIFETSDGKEKKQKFDKVLIAAGRKPNSDNIGLENTDIETDDKGFIKVDEKRRTNNKKIFAIGDVAGEPMLAHKATHEGRVAAEVISGLESAFEPSAVPAVIFTDPEIAWCGITENEAKGNNMDVKVTKFNWTASGRAVTLERTDGLTKIIADSESGRILGVGISGKSAGEMIAEGVLAVEMAANAKDLSLTIHPHPTLTETIMEAAELMEGSSTHSFRKKSKKNNS